MRDSDRSEDEDGEDDDDDGDDGVWSSTLPYRCDWWGVNLKRQGTKGRQRH